MMAGLTLLHVFRMGLVAFLNDVPLYHYCQKVYDDTTVSGFGEGETQPCT